MINCPRCGAAVEDGKPFCPNCGTSLSAAPAYATRDAGSASGTPVSFPQRNIVLCIVLSIVTLGIYGLIWTVKMVDDVNEASAEPNATSGAMVLVLTLVTCGIYWLIWVYKSGELMNNAKSSRGLATDPNSSVLWLVLSIFGLGIVVYYFIQNDLNKIAALYGNPQA